MHAKLIYGLGTLIACWLLMQAAHEAGHVAGAWLTGGRVQRVVLHPLAISRTDVSPNPSPLVEIWAGPVLGVAIPLALWSLAAVRRMPLASWLRFFAGFCLIANGGYLSSGVIDPVGDAEEMLQHGTPAWTLALFGVVSLLAGFCLWHGLGPEFGWGPRGKPISWGAAVGMAGFVVLIMVVELAMQ